MHGAAWLIAALVTAPAADAGALRVSRVFTRLGLWEGQVEVRQAWTFVNGGAEPFDGSRGSPTGERGLLIRLPEGAVQVEASGPQGAAVEAIGNKVVYGGVVAPGPAGAVEIRVSYALDYAGPALAIDQPSAYPIDALETVVPELPVVRMRRAEGVRLTVTGHNHATLQSADEDGAPVWVLSGRPAGPGIRLEVAGLPYRDRTSVWMALVVAAGVALWGAARVLARPPARPAPAPGPAPGPAPDEAAALRERRERLIERLVGLERDRERGRVDDEDYLRRRQAIKRRVIDVERRLGA